MKRRERAQSGDAAGFEVEGDNDLITPGRPPKARGGVRNLKISSSSPRKSV